MPILFLFIVIIMVFFLCVCVCEFLLFFLRIHIFFFFSQVKQTLMGLMNAMNALFLYYDIFLGVFDSMNGDFS